MAVLRSTPQLEFAVVGGGIVGVMLAMGLIKRGIKVAVYEQASCFREIGAGVAFTANALQCMALIDPAIVEAVKAVATPNGDPDNPTDYLQWLDGYNYDPDDVENTDDRLLFKLYVGHRGFEGCHRAHLLAEMAKRIDHSIFHFGKRLVTYDQPALNTAMAMGKPGSGRVCLRFEDGTTAHADAVIGCDGIKSRVRKVLLGPSHPAAHPTFTHKLAYRALVPIPEAERVVGSYRARNQHMHLGPGAHILHLPVAGQTLVNIVAFVDEPGEWPFQEMVAPAKRSEVERVFASWGPTVRALVGLLPENLDKYAVFDTYDHPAPTYVDGRVCIAGDAAHASSPHHGAGAGIGVEDALALCALVQLVHEDVGNAAVALGTSSREAEEESVGSRLERAFAAYDQVRRARSQWLVRSSREACEIYELKWPGTMDDMDKVFAEITERSHKIWHFDIKGMLRQLEDLYRRRQLPN